MILGFDIGNTDIYGGLLRGSELVLEFRKANHLRPSADEFGVFCLQILEAHGIAVEDLSAVAVASVVPDSNAMVMAASEKYLGKRPLLLQTGVRTGLSIRTRNPNEVGADRIANAIAGVARHPGKDLIIVDLGTATTFCAVTRERVYLGGVIAAGMALSMRALAQNTAKLPYVDLVGRGEGECLGRTTVESIQSGAYFGHLGLMREVIGRLRAEAFEGRPPVVIGTGGHSRFFKDSGIFNEIVPDLVLQGLRLAVEYNQNGAEAKGGKAT